MKKYILSLALLATCALAGELKYQEIEGFLSPESVFVDKNAVYVSNVGKKLEPLAKDNDGFISKLDKNGKVLEYKFLSGLNAPKGMKEIDNILYVVDIDTLKGFDLSTKKEVFTLPIKGAIFLNDIEKLNDTTLLISDTGTGIVHKIDLKTKKYDELLKLDLKEFGGPNGLFLHQNLLYIAGYDPSGVSGGMVLSYDLKNKKIQVIKSEKEPYDGIVLKNNILYVSSWGKDLKGVIYALNLKNKSVKKLDLPLIKGPADIFLDKNNLWIPKMAEGKILKVELE
ncbi:NHL repeat-containing protein [Campylobacter taeniopygiae]|uniref:ATP-binding protein n=1 Tax=Campylobacter taeniopygiae TaxID=2510188 RepID=A0ABY2TM21_9BACT|nr:ATP-binding protein [Campylobacter taeniopygiae]TKX34415.1 ATP-binding protein [Campylobacter taeniopygiae]